MDLNLQKYMAFVKTAECGSFTEAARLLNYSQSGISRMIRDLEREWGVRLLCRDRSGVRLTSEGRQLLPAARKVCAEFEALQRQAEEMRGLDTGLIRIGTFSSVATYWLPKIIREFQKDFPGIAYELLLGDYTEIEQWIREGRADCGFLRLPAGPEFETVFLEQDELKVILPEDHPLAGCERFPMHALEESPFLLLEKDGNEVVSDIFRKHQLHPDIRFTTWEDHAILAMVESGLGISILPELVLGRIPWAVTVKPLEVPAYRRIGLAMADSRNISRPVREFLKYLDRR